MSIASTAAQTQIEYQITVNTSAIKGVTGYIDFQLNPDLVGSYGVQAAITQFKSDTQGLGSATMTGDVTGGVFPLDTIIHNTNGWNDITQNAIFGKTMTFFLTLSGPAISTPFEAHGGTLFTLGLFNSDQVSPLLSTRPDGMLLHLYIRQDGKVTVDEDAGGVSFVSVHPVLHDIRTGPAPRQGIGTPRPH